MTEVPLSELRRRVIGVKKIFAIEETKHVSPQTLNRPQRAQYTNAYGTKEAVNERGVLQLARKERRRRRMRLRAKRGRGCAG